VPVTIVPTRCIHLHYSFAWASRAVCSSSAQYRARNGGMQCMGQEPRRRRAHPGVSGVAAGRPWRVCHESHQCR
jgi:hypothetical protein